MTVEHLNLSDLKAKTPAELLAMAEEWEIENAPSMRKGEMMFSLLKEHAEEGWEIGGDGVLEVMQDGFGFLRSTSANYLAGPDDIYVNPELLRQYSLRTGDTIEGLIQAPRDNERYFSLTKVTRINFGDPEKARHKVLFDNLTPLYPDERLKMEIEDPTIKDRSARIIDLVSPIGKGQRALIVAPPRTGKTVLLQNIAHSIATNHPECYLIVLLIDERPEEVTDMQRSVKGEVVSSTFDEPATRHVAATRPCATRWRPLSARCSRGWWFPAPAWRGCAAPVACWSSPSGRQDEAPASAMRRWWREPKPSAAARWCVPCGATRAAS